MTKINITIFNDFNVHFIDNHTTFIHINLSDNNDFYEEMFEYFFDESRLLQYIENKSNLQFNNSEVDSVTLFKHLENYIDDFNIEKELIDVEEEVIKILNDEYSLEDIGDGKLRVRLDKMGKIGELLFCNLLSEYFNFNCIIPKCNLITDSNMNVYGIDALYYSAQHDMILFGESKLSKSLSNGIGLINKSLSEYESQIKEEFRLIISNRLLRDKMGLFGDKYNDIVDKCISIETFINKADIKKIGVPIFIAHGTDNDVTDILKKLKSINKPDFFSIETIYFIISIPIFNKSKFISVFTKLIKERRALYEPV